MEARSCCVVVSICLLSVVISGGALGQMGAAAESPEVNPVSAAPLITRATGFHGMTEAEVLTWMYRGIVGATAEGGTFEYRSPVPEGNLPQGVSAETLKPVDPDLVGLLRLDLRDSWMVFSVIERVAGASPEVEFDEKKPTPKAYRVYKWDEERKTMVPHALGADEGFNYCMLVLTVTPEGTIDAKIFVYDLAFFRVNAYSWQLLLNHETHPPSFRLGGYRSLGAVGVF